jgi:hypothetical protein
MPAAPAEQPRALAWRERPALGSIRRGGTDGGEPLYARMHTLELTAEQYDRGLRLIIDDLLPWVRDSGGFRGVLGLVDRERGKALVFTFWADEDALDRSAEAGERLSVLAAAASGATRRSLEAYEVSIFELQP